MYIQSRQIGSYRCWNIHEGVASHTWVMSYVWRWDALNIVARTFMYIQSRQIGSYRCLATHLDESHHTHEWCHAYECGTPHTCTHTLMYTHSRCVLQCVAVCCSVLQCVAVCWHLTHARTHRCTHTAARFDHNDIRQHTWMRLEVSFGKEPCKRDCILQKRPMYVSRDTYIWVMSYVVSRLLTFIGLFWKRVL